LHSRAKLKLRRSKRRQKLLPSRHRVEHQL